jgi:predicted sulfurtransferase
MAARKTVDRETVKQILARAKRGQTRREIIEEMKLDERVVGTVLAANGATNSKPGVVKRDKEKLARWLAASDVAAKRPAVKTAASKKTTAKKTTARKKQAVGASA